VKSITEIFNMLDWNLPSEIQAEGRKSAKEIENIEPFLQPLTPEYSKNIWDNCAVIIAERSDEELHPYLYELLEWLQDMNWPGAFCIFYRLKKYAKWHELSNAISISLAKAEANNDDVWKDNLRML